MRRYNIEKNDAGQRLDSFLTKALPYMSTSLLQKLIRQKRIKLNGKRSEPAARLFPGDTVEIHVYEENLAAPPQKDVLSDLQPRLTVVYEDENILLADKEPGLLCHPGEGPSEPTLIDHIQAHLRQKGDWDPARENAFAPALCNRIDRNTGGLVLAAKTAEALRILNEKIRLRELDKRYLCVVHGEIKPPKGRLRDYIARDTEAKRVYVERERGGEAKTAVLEYRTLSVRRDNPGGGSLSLLECRLITGRTHQIRAQLAAAGHPLLGDGKYGTNVQNKPYGYKYQALYAWRLKFDFKTDAGVLGYLNGMEFQVKEVPFVEDLGFMLPEDTL